jgi:hypothetical protein
MPEIIGVFDGETTTIHHQGRPYNVGVIHLKITKGEAAPEIITGYCRLNYKEGIIKNLKRITWAKLEDPANAGQKPAEMAEAQNKPKEVVIPAEAGIQGATT